MAGTLGLTRFNASLPEGEQQPAANWEPIAIRGNQTKVRSLQGVVFLTVLLVR